MPTGYTHLRPLSSIHLPIGDIAILGLERFAPLVKSVYTRGLIQPLEVIEYRSAHGRPTYYLLDGVSRYFAVRIAFPKALDILCFNRPMKIVGELHPTVYVAQWRASRPIELMEERRTVYETLAYLSTLGIHL